MTQKAIFTWTLSLSLLTCFSACGEIKMPDPSGPYKVGTTLMDLTDNSRKETLTNIAGLNRRILFRVWYPAENTNGCIRNFYQSKMMIKALEKQYKFPEGVMGEPVETDVFINAPIGLKEKSYPVILFSHGFGSFENQNYTQMAELASRGYIVISINYPYESVLSEFSDGTTAICQETKYTTVMKKFEKDPNDYGKKVSALFQSIKNQNSVTNKRKAVVAMTHSEIYQPLQDQLETRVKDNLFILESLKSLNTKIPFKGRMDLERIGAYGHSFGAASISETCFREPLKIKAGISLDAMVFMDKESKDTGLKIPFLFVYSTANKAGKYIIDWAGVNDFLAESTSAPFYSLTVKGTGHMSFSDLTYISMMKFTGINGTIDGNKCGKMMQEVISAFFDKYLKGIDSPILQKIPAEYKELTMKSWNTK